MVLSQESCYQKYSDATAEESCIANVVTKKLHAENCRYIKNMPLTEKNIEKICKWFQLSYSISNDTVFIRTAFASWIVYLQDNNCLLYTSDAADEEDSEDLGGRRIIKKKKSHIRGCCVRCEAK